MKTVKLRFATTTSPCTCGDYGDDHHVEDDDVDVDDNDHEGHNNFSVHIVTIKKGTITFCELKCPGLSLHIQI